MEKRLREKLDDGAFAGVSPSRSRTMSAIRGRGNRTTERRLRSALVRAGLRGWKVRPVGIVGSPDFYFPDKHVAVFVDGCFWHGCPQCGHIPKTRSAFWAAKIERNRERDQQNTDRLLSSGIAVIRLWEHDLQTNVARCVETITKAVKDSPLFPVDEPAIATPASR